MLKRLFSIQYSDKLILEMLNGSLSGVVASNFITPVIAIIVLYDYVPHQLLILWFSLHMVLILLKIYMVPQLRQAIKNQSSYIKRYLNHYIFITLLTSVLLAIISWLSVLYEVPDNNIFIIANLTVALSAGAIGTIGTIFIAFLGFMVISIVPLLFALLYHGGMMFNIFVFILLVYLIVHSKSGYRLFLSYQRTLEVEQEITDLNKTLESKVKHEVDKNREKDKQIFQQSRLAQMGEMISMIAHQWRQPLSAISSTSTAIQLKSKLNKLDSDTAIRLAGNISDYSQHLSATIDAFREFFKPHKEKKETNYTELVTSVLKIFETSMSSKNIQVITQLNCNKNFLTYPNEIKQVILNLLKNAEDALLENKQQDAPCITIESNDSCLTISDNGGGVAKKYLDEIFAPYFSTKNKDGTGLGLYMSKIIIEEHCGGSLTVANNLQGAVFKITL